MMLSSFGPGLDAEIAYRRERIAQAARPARWLRRVRRNRARRPGRPMTAARSTGRIGAINPAR